MDLCEAITVMNGNGRVTHEIINKYGFDYLYRKDGCLFRGFVDATRNEMDLSLTLFNLPLDDWKNYSEIKPCPFCGDSADLTVMQGQKRKKYSVVCCYCHSSSDEYLTDTGAIHQWNKRE